MNKHFNTLTKSNPQKGFVLVEALLKLFLIISTVVAFYLSTEWVINTARDVSYYVKYEKVNPTQKCFNTVKGEIPEFVSKRERYVGYYGTFTDVMWCEPLTGPFVGVPTRIEPTNNGVLEYLHPSKSGGEVPENGYTKENQSGKWEWSGRVPRRDSYCWLEPGHTVNPSLGVVKKVPIDPTEGFYIITSKDSCEIE